MYSSIFINLTFAGYFLASIVYSISLFVNKRQVYISAVTLYILGFVFNTAAIIGRWSEGTRPPFSNMYESLLLLAWAIALVYLGINLIYRIKSLGVFAAFASLVSLGYTSLLDSSIEPLMPALQSNWLTIHVVALFISYAAFTVSYVAAVAYLIKRKGIDMGLAIYSICLAVVGPTLIFALARGGLLGRFTQSTGWIILLGFINLAISLVLWAPLYFVIKATKIEKHMPEESLLDSVVYKSIAFGFPFFVFGTIAGAVWANKAWGRYWGWDPKETWSFITLLVYAIYLHLRYLKGWKGRSANLFSIVGFLVVIITFIGVNYIISGLHSYAE